MEQLPRTMTEIAVLEIKKGIMRGDFPPRMRLIPAKLEVTLGLSRIAIREAIRELVGSGLLASETNKGAYIKDPLNIDEIREMFDFRYQIEGRAAYLGSQHVTEDDLIRMEALLDEFETINKPSEGYFLNQEFHMILYRATGWKSLIQIIRVMFDQVMAFRSSLYRRYYEKTEEVNFEADYLKSYIVEHHDLLCSLRERKADEVRQKTVSHLKKLGFDDIYQLYRKTIKLNR